LEPPADRRTKADVKPRWRLKKTLSRKLDYRPIEQEDIKYLWAAYKKGALASMGAEWGDPTLNADDFTLSFKAEVMANYAAAWTLFAGTPKGFLPVGVVLAFFSHPNPRFSPFMIVGDMIWFPWASRRNRVEAAVHFFSKVRKEHALVTYAHGAETKRFFEMIAKHGVIQRIGTTFSVVSGQPVAMFETRRK
jgi:hypothetical protein